MSSDAWAGAWGVSWSFSWGSAVTPPGPTPTPATETQVPGGGGLSGYGAGRIDYKARESIAAEFKKLYQDIYDKAAPDSEIADEAAALVASYAPTSAPDFPPPQSVDWNAIVEDGKIVVLQFRTTLLAFQRRLDEIDARRTIDAIELERLRLLDDEEAASILLLSM